jgi:hypothetical protein
MSSMSSTPASRALKGLLGLLVAALLLGSEVPPAPPPPAPLVGFSYSPELSQWMHTDPATDLRALLDATQPDLVRLPVYWDVAQPSPRALDFSSVDSLLAVVTDHNAVSSRPTRVILTVGARNFVYPELHAPAWAGPRQQPQLGLAQRGAAYRTYFDAAVLRYRDSPLLYAWQVENEPNDYVINLITGEDEIAPAQIQWEIDEVHRLDPAHRAVTTTYNAWNVIMDWMQVNTPPILGAWHAYPSGHPEQSLDQADALGLDIYVDGPSTPLRFTSVALRASWKAETMRYWADFAQSEHKQLWLTEMQAQPWAGAGGGFSTEDLLMTARTYRTDPLSVVLLWGVETWLQDPAWMRAAVQAMDILRAPDQR